MIDSNPVVGAYLRDVLKCRGLSAAELASALGVNQRTVFNWMSGESRPGKDEADDLRLCLGLDPRWPVVAMDGGSGGNAPFVDPGFSHPHRDLVKDLANEASCGMHKEVLGPPGVFKTAVLGDVKRRLAAEGRSPQDCIYLSCREDVGGIDGFWDALGQRAEARDAPYRYSDLKALVSKRRCVLLLDHLDEFLLHLRFHFPAEHDFGRLASQWMADLRDLPAGIMAASTIHSAAHLRFVAPNYPSSIFLPARFYEPVKDAEWNLWTVATIVRFGQGELNLEANTWRLARELKHEVFKVPIAFTKCLTRLSVLDGPRYSDRRVGVKTVLRDVMQMLGDCIWNRIPGRVRRDLFAQKFTFPPESSIAVAFRNSGILVEDRDEQQGAVLKPLVPDWISQWRREAVP